MNELDIILVVVAVVLAGAGLGAWRFRTNRQAAETKDEAEATDSADAIGIYEIAGRLSDFYEMAAHPAELEGNEVFAEGVEFLGHPDASERDLLRFATGDNNLAACMALEALCRRGESAEVTNAVVGSIGTLWNYPRFFALKYLASVASKETRVIGRVLVATTYFMDERLAKNCLEEFVRQRHARGEALVFEEEISSLDEDDLKTLDQFLTEIDSSFGQPLRENLARAVANIRGSKELRAAGRVWTDRDAEEAKLLIRHSALEEAVALIRQSLTAERPQSVLITGERGVGKTTIQRVLAQQLFEEGWTIFVAGSSDIQAGQRYIGELEERLKKIIKRMTGDQHAVWFIPNIDRLAYAGTHKYNLESVLDTILPYVESGALRIVAEAEPTGRDRLLQTHPRMSTALSMLTIEPMPQETAVDIAGQWLALRAAGEHAQLLGDLWELAQQYLGDRAAPGNIMELLQSTILRLVAGTTGETPKVSVDDVIVTLAQQTGLPLELIDPRRELDLDGLSAALSARVIGQDEAAQCLVERVAMMKAGLADPTRPAGVFLFAGPTGTGKTEIAKSLAAWLFGSAERLIRVDMSELQTEQSIGRLLGHSGDSSTESLTDQIRKQPFSVVLLDEFEKAHENVWDLFLQVFDDARMTDRSGQTAHFNHAIIILTANLGATIPTGLSIGFGSAAKAFDANEVSRAVDKVFRREFINRLDRVIVFRPLDRSLMRKILQKELVDVFERRGLRGRSWAVEWDEQAVSFLLEKGFTPDLGARPLKRAVERYLLSPLAETIVRNQVPEGDQFLFISCKGDALQVAFIDPGLDDGDTGGAEIDATPVEEETESDGKFDVRAVLLQLKHSPQDVIALRNSLQDLDKAIASSSWQSKRDRSMHEMGQPDFWSSQSRFAALGLLEYGDRVENGLDRARSLLSRLENYKADDPLPHRLVSMFAQNIYLLATAIDDVLEERPSEAFLSVEIYGDPPSGIAEVAGFGTRIANMYEAWAGARNMRLTCLQQTGKPIAGKTQALYAVSGYGAHSLLASETGLHVYERPAEGAQRSARYSIRVIVVPQPVTPLPLSEVAQRNAATNALSNARLSEPIVVRRYREKPSPLVRDSARGWRTGRIDLVLGGNFDLF